MNSMRKTLLFCVCHLLIQLRPGGCFNVDVSNAIVFNGTGLSDGYFGYTVLQLINRHGQWVLVGAPKDNSTYEPSLNRPGVLYKCSVQPPHECEQVKLDDKGNERHDSGPPYYADSKDDQWLGVSMTRQDTEDGSIAVCGHRWANKFYSNQIFPKGVCYVLNHDLDFSSVNKISPCLGERKIASDANNNGVAWFGWCQAGFSSHFIPQSQTLLLGAVGTAAWRGSVISLASGTTRLPILGWFGSDESIKKTTYTGYSMSSGHFSSANTREGVTGAPRAYQTGAVFIFEMDNFEVLEEQTGDQMGSYYGGSICVVDLNSDGLSDLLVGAPLYATTVDEGRVYVYINYGQSVLQQTPFLLHGSNAPNARFGSSIASIGDINMDGYRDVAIGAPYEGSGVVYIYHGTSSGISSDYIQAIRGETVAPGIQSFGISLSGGLDLDGNAYQDIAVGAYLSNTAVLFKTRPVIDVHARLHITPDQISLNTTQCVYNNKPANCIRALVCLEYKGTAVPGRIGLKVSLELEQYKLQSGQKARVHFVSNDTAVGTLLTDTVVLRYRRMFCSHYEIHIKKNINDYLTPIPIHLSYELVTTDSPVTVCSDICPVLNVNIPTTVQQEVAFVRNCGEDELCVADLQLSAEFNLPRGYTFLPVGVLNQIVVRISVRNDGEEAHQAQLFISYPKELMFVRVENNNLNAVVQCEPDNSVSSNVTSGDKCSVGNPMPPRSENVFEIKLDSSQISGDWDTLDISLVATTSSNDTTPADNFVTLSLPIHIEADITIAGMSVPEQIHIVPVIGDASRDQSQSCHDVGSRLTHAFDVRNLGRGNIPYNSHVRIEWPWKTLEGDYLLFIKRVEVHGTGMCRAEHIFFEQESDKFCNKTSVPDTVLLSSLKEKTLDCSHVQCVSLDCYIGPLDIDSSTFIEITAVLQQSTVTKFVDDVVEITSSAVVTVENPSGRFVQPTADKPDYVQVITQVSGMTSEDSSPVEPWVIALSACVGFLALAISVVILWKLGFFRRREKEELEKLLSTSKEEGLSNWTIPCENPSSVVDNNGAMYMNDDTSDDDRNEPFF